MSPAFTLVLAAALLAAGIFGLSSVATSPAFAQVGDGAIQMSALRHDTFDGYYRTPFAAVPEGTAVRLRFRTAINDVQSVTVFYYQFDPSSASNTANSPISFAMTFLENRAEGGATYSFWEYNLVTPSTPAVVYYKFKISDGSTTAYYSDL